MTTKGLLVGYIRRSKRGKALKIDMGLEEFLTATRYKGKDGKEYVGMVVNKDAILDVLNGKREVTSICQLRK